MRLWRLLGHDLAFQFRHGFYYAYLLISVLYVVLLRSLPHDIRLYLAPVFIFSDPSVIGAFFVGGIILLERGQGITRSLSVTPVRVGEYVAARVLSLALLSVLSSLFIAVLSLGPDIGLARLVAGVLLVAPFFTMIGVGIASRVTTLNQYLMASPVFMTPFFLPLAEHLDLIKLPYMDLLPGTIPLTLIDGGITGAVVSATPTAWVALAAWNTGAFFLSSWLVDRNWSLRGEVRR